MNDLDPDQDRNSVGLDLGLFAKVISRRQKITACKERVK